MDDNPIVKALPPETDYLTYLTIVEYNLTKERLPSLHTVLQDSDLTINIGWDLVHILLPLLPESKQCLEDVARLGNPREVILKVTELLEELGRDEGSDDGEGGEYQENAAEIETAAEDGHEANLSRPQPDHAPRNDVTPSPLLKTLKFQLLILMLSILHPRIKTKFPSRFLATSLQAILPAYIQSFQVFTSTSTLLSFIRTVAASTRPRLPPRAGSTAPAEPEPAPDPEASVEPSGSEEAALQLRLLQAFLTHVVEAWFEALADGGDANGLDWAGRFWEMKYPDRLLRGRECVEEASERTRQLETREMIVRDMMSLARELKISPKELLSIVTRPEVIPKGDPDDLPSLPSEISLSHTGSLYLFTATQFYEPDSLEPPSLSTYWRILDQFKPSLGLVNNAIPGSFPVVDAIVFVGLLVFQNLPLSQIRESTESQNVDNQALSRVQALSEICATNPSQRLRSQAHNLISEIMTKYPEPSLRKDFLLSTLRDTPYTSLKASAVTWYKEGLLEATNAADKDPSVLDHEKSFLRDVFPHLYPQPAHLSKAPTLAIVHDIPFLLTTFNLYYLLYSNVRLRETFGLEGLNEELHFTNTRLRPWELRLRSAKDVIREEGGEGGEDQAGWETNQLILLEEVLGRVRGLLEGGG